MGDLLYQKSPKNVTGDENSGEIILFLQNNSLFFSILQVVVPQKTGPSRTADEDMDPLFPIAQLLTVFVSAVRNVWRKYQT